MKVFSLLEFAAQLHAVDRDLHELGPAIVERACQMVQKKAKAAIGKNHELWPTLAESTIADKQAHGYAVPKPLLRTGELRDSIEYVVRGHEGAVGSNLEIAVFQELGTSRIPPRSFLVSSAISSEDKIHRMAGAAAIAALSGYGHNARGVAELMHMLHAAGHVLKEAVEDLFEDDDDNDSRK